MMKNGHNVYLNLLPDSLFPSPPLPTHLNPSPLSHLLTSSFPHYSSSLLLSLQILFLFFLSFFVFSCPPLSPLLHFPLFSSLHSNPFLSPLFSYSPFPFLSFPLFPSILHLFSPVFSSFSLSTIISLFPINTFHFSNIFSPFSFPLFPLPSLCIHSDYSLHYYSHRLARPRYLLLSFISSSLFLFFPSLSLLRLITLWSTSFLLFLSISPTLNPFSPLSSSTLLNLSVSLCSNQSIYISIFISICLSIYLSVYLSS